MDTIKGYDPTLEVWSSILSDGRLYGILVEDFILFDLVNVGFFIS